MAIKLGMTTLNLLLLHLLLVPYASAYEDMIIQQVTQRKTAPLALYVDPLPQTQKIYAYPSTTNLTIGMYQTTQQFHRDLPPTPIFAYGPNASSATFPGPTIETLRGTPTYVTWENNLPPTHILPVDTTINAAMPPNGGVPAVVHLHGGVIAPDSDGSAFAWYTANYASNGSAFTTKTYTYPNVQHAGNLMYHDHALGLTRINLLAGLLGGYVIRDPPVETPFNLPTGDEFDRHLVIADRSFNADGTIYMNATGVDPAVHPVWQPEYFGDAITVNGKIWPFLNVQRRKYRFRIINASNARYLSLSFSANGSAPYPFTVIGSDSSYLGAPVTATSVVAAVAETFDIVFDFSAVTANEIELINAAPYPYPNGLNIPGNYDSKVMNFVISPVAPVPADTSSIPATLVSYEPAMPSDATTTRYIALYEYFTPANQVMHLYVNGKRLADPVTETPTVGSTELWYVINLTGDDHPLHLHLAHIQAVSSTALANPVDFKACMEVNLDPLLCNISGNTTGTAVTVVPDYEKTWKNVVKLPPGMMTTVIAKFKAVDLSTQPYPFNATIEPGYVYHCHILDHEDNEMIRPLKLQ